MSLERSIKATVAYFSLFDYPLTVFEIQKWLWSPQPVSLPAVYEALRQTGELEEKDGFFFLPGASGSVGRRLRTYFDNQKKIKRAQNSARLASWLPFWRLVAVVNTAALDNSRPGSDIDWLVVAKEGRLWTTRFLITSWLCLFGRWRHGRKIRDRVCLSFFLTDNNLNLSALALPQGDVYLTYWPTQFIPLLSFEQTLEKFTQNNLWITQNLANFDFKYLAPDGRGLTLGRAAGALRWFWEKLLGGAAGDALEHFLRRLQLAKMSRREAARREGQAPNAVVVSDWMLKFHEIDRRAEFHQRWQSLLST